MPKVSVIVPIYNCEKYVEKCVRSLFEQTLDDIEYIFVNDCTPDNSIAVINAVMIEYSNRIEQVSIIVNKTNNGPSFSRNVGLRRAKGEYVIFCDSDDYVESVAYEEMYLLAKGEDADVVACAIGYYNEDDNCLGVEKYGAAMLTRESLYNLRRIEGGIHSTSCNKLVSRFFLLQNSIFFADEIRMWDDLYITFKYRYFANKICIIDKPFYHYIIHTNSVTHEDGQKKTESQIKCAKLICDYFTPLSTDKELRRSLMFLKFRSKQALYRRETLKSWMLLFPESHKYIWSFRSYYGNKLALEQILVAYLGHIGWNLIEIIRRIKNS